MKKQLAVLWYAVIAAFAAGTAFGQPYPSRPVRLVVPFSAGAGVTDIMARLVGQKLTDALGQQVVIDNHPGAGGVPGTDIVAKATPDGYTLLMTNVAFTVNGFLYARLPYDALKDFTPVTAVNSAPLVLVVNPSVPAKSVAELVALAKAKPGGLNYGSGGVGSTPHLAGELFRSLAGIDMTHIPYKGGAPALTDLVAGQISVMIENVPGTMPFVRSGKLRALAISSPKRSPLEPDLPTISEAGVPGYEVIGWNGIVAVNGTPRPVVDRIYAETAKILRSPEVVQRLATLGAEPIANTPAEFAAFIKSEMARWGKIIKERGIRAE